ncbi:MAG TPA: shikimate kinase [Candidatus Cybelea sp.]|nr:shikimate kinase [Candidatus Cybelea sp.]
MALAGFMASGKSTIGRRLARRLSWEFCDTDSLVTREHGAIADIFTSEGEPAFRAYEHDALAAALDRPVSTVIALGGGTLTLAANRELVRHRAYCVFIKVSPKQILARILRSREARPLLGNDPTLARISELYAKRMADYESADFAIDASRRSDAQVIAEILHWLRERKILTAGDAS